MRDTAAAASALGAYLATVLPRARRELRQLGPLPEAKERNAEAVAVFATLAPRAARTSVVRAIVALQVAVDLRDEIEEEDEGKEHGQAARLEALEGRWRREVAALPSHAAVMPLLEAAVERCEQGQRHTHLAAQEGSDALRRWAEGLPAPPDYRWWELAAGASSSVAAHALIAAAADPGTTAETATSIDAAYHPPVGALTVFLDDLVDREEDREAGEHNYVGYYTSSGEAAERLTMLASRSLRLIAPLPQARRHEAILAGVAAYYLCDRRATTPFARPIRQSLLATLGPSTRLVAGFVRLRGLRERKRPGQEGTSPGP